MSEPTSFSHPPGVSLPGRNDSIEALRAIAVLAVIMIHTKPFMRDLFPGSEYRLLEYLFNQPQRFAVPFFFVTAGYFLGRKAQSDPQRQVRIQSYVLRLLVVMLGWSLIYMFVPSYWPPLLTQGYWQVTAEKIASLTASPLTLLLEGGRIHLWFIPALIMGTVLLAIFSRNGRIWPACLFSGLLFCFGLLAGSYGDTPLGIKPPFITRDGPFLSFICMTIGYVLSLRRTPFSLGTGCLVAVGGMTLQVLESWLLWLWYAKPMINHDYLIGTVIFGAGLLMVALAAPHLGRKGNLHTLGRYTLGVYACHLLFVDLLGPFTRYLELHVWQLLLPLLAYLLSVALTDVMARCPGINRLV